ncbi:hypothetical protein RJG79_01850 [Mycoplasmatota bacterium WC44]
MLLELLNKKEKHFFLDLAAFMTKADGIIEDSESITLKLMTNEMGKEAKGYRAKDHNKAKEALSESSKLAQRVVLLNLITLSLSDDFYHAEEHAFVEELLDKWGVTPKKKAELVKLVYARKDLREKAKIIISE